MVGRGDPTMGGQPDSSLESTQQSWLIFRINNIVNKKKNTKFQI